MESELLNAVNYIKNISKKKVIFAKIDLDNIIDSFIENGFIQVTGRWRKYSFPNCR